MGCHAKLCPERLLEGWLVVLRPICTGSLRLADLVRGASTVSVVGELSSNCNGVVAAGFLRYSRLLPWELKDVGEGGVLVPIGGGVVDGAAARALVRLEFRLWFRFSQ